MTFPPPIPPLPDLVRQPRESFGWLEDRLLHEMWLARIGPDAVAVLVLLALAADRRGASFYSRSRMSISLGIDASRIDAALHRLLEMELVLLRPWKHEHRDGVWQLLPLPYPPAGRREGETLPLHAVLARLGLKA
jgi:hypothetical protein